MRPKTGGGGGVRWRSRLRPSVRKCELNITFCTVLVCQWRYTLVPINCTHHGSCVLYRCNVRHANPSPNPPFPSPDSHSTPAPLPPRMEMIATSPPPYCNTKFGISSASVARMWADKVLEWVMMGSDSGMRRFAVAVLDPFPALGISPVAAGLQALCVFVLLKGVSVGKNITTVLTALKV